MTSKSKDRLPSNLDVAGIFAALFLRLGGTFTVGSNGVRYVGRPEPALFRLQKRGLPQLLESEPWEQFHSADEWRGALKLVDYVLTRLSESDQDWVFGCFASVAMDDRKQFDFLERLR